MISLVKARRIFAIGARNYAEHNNIDEVQAEMDYTISKNRCKMEDARRAVQTLSDCADSFNTTTAQLLAMLS